MNIDFYNIPDEVKAKILNELEEYRRKWTSEGFVVDDEALQEQAGYLVQRAKENKEINGPEKWHDALTRYTELEVRVARLEHTVYVLEHELANFMGRFANKA